MSDDINTRQDLLAQRDQAESEIADLKQRLAKAETLNMQAAKAETARLAWTEIGAKAQADAATIRQAAEIVRAEYSTLLERPLPDVYATMQRLRWPVGHLALVVEVHDSGAALLTELEAARRVINVLKEWRSGDVSGSALTIALTAYDDAVKVRTE